MCLAHRKWSLKVSYHYYNEFDIYVHTFLLKYLENKSLEEVLMVTALQIWFFIMMLAMKRHQTYSNRNEH